MSDGLANAHDTAPSGWQPTRAREERASLQTQTTRLASSSGPVVFRLSSFGSIKDVSIYTDGACSGNPGPGGWAAVLQYGQPPIEKVLSGHEAETTNNRMELMAALAALEALREPCRVALHSDSAYLVNAFNDRWIDGWQRRGWKKSDKKPVLNRDLWERLIAQNDRHEVRWIKVKGHAGIPMNERVDGLAVHALNVGREEREPGSGRFQ